MNQRFPPWGVEARIEEASELFNRAGNLFKASRQPTDAEKSYLTAAECLLRVKQLHEAASNYVSAANAIRKTDATRAATHLKTSVQYLISGGNFAIAAKNLQDAGELFEQENNPEEAMECLKSAADYYESENQPSRSSTCLLKVAQMLAQAEKYDEAIALYEKVAKASIDNSLTKWSVKDYLFKAGLCQLCKGDLIGAKRALEQYAELDVTFAGTRENKLLGAIMTAYEGYDVDAFTAAVQEFDSITPLPPFITTLLLRIKNRITAEGGGSNASLT